MNIASRKTRRLSIVAAVVAATSLSGCNLATRLSEVGSGPALTNIENPTAKPEYRPVSLPMPAPQVAEENPSSLWRNGARAFFKDHRAKEIGDIVTVKLELSDSATLENSTERDRNDGEDRGNNTQAKRCPPNKQRHDGWPAGNFTFPAEMMAPYCKASGGQTLTTSCGTLKSKDIYTRIAWKVNKM